MKERIQWIDFARGICIFCVMLSHLNYTPILYHYIFIPFFLTLFFFISGYLIKINSSQILFKKLINNLVVPYFILCVVDLFTHRLAIMALINYNYDYFIKEIFLTITGQKFWFIPCLIIVQSFFIIMLPIIKKISDKTKLLLSIFFICTIFLLRQKSSSHLFWNLDTAIYAFGYYMLGFTFSSMNLFKIIINKFKKPKLFSLVTILFYLLFVISINYILNGICVDIHNNVIEYPLLFVFLSICGIISVSLFCINFNIGKYFSFLGMNSLLVFVFHGRIFYIVQLIFDFIHLNYLFPSNYVYSLCFVFSSGCILIVLSLFVNRYLPLLVGKKKLLKY